MYGSLVIALSKIDRSVNELEVDVRIGRLEFIDTFLHRLCDDDVARSFRSLDSERNDRLAVEPCKGSAVCNRVGHDAKIIKTHLATHRHADHRRRQFTERPRRSERADSLIAP